jgi:hypothetical protein
VGHGVGAIPVYKHLVGIPAAFDSSKWTNVLKYSAFKLGLDQRFTGATLRSLSKSVFGSVKIPTVLGRANMVIGTALLAYDLTSIGMCAADK